jgi:hypothetical protein
MSGFFKPLVQGYAVRWHSTAPELWSGKRLVADRRQIERLAPADTDHRRVLAVLRYLEAR